MRTKSTIKNGIWAVASFGVCFFLALVARRAFLENFSAGLLGYAGVISNFFSLLSVAELGVGTVISYGLYQELQRQNRDEIAELMMIYKWIYRVIGIVVLSVGIVCYFLLPFIIVEPDADWYSIRWIYAFELGNAIIIYFLSYRRLLFVADQKAYLCVKIESVFQILSFALRILLAYFTQQYLLYLAMAMLCNAAANLCIAVLYRRNYPYAVKKKVTLADIRQRGLFGDIASYGMQKLSVAIYGGIDNIVAMRVLGPLSVVTLTNYTTIESGVNDFFNKLLSGFQPSVGNLVHDENREGKQSVFEGLNLLSFCLAAFATVSYSVLLQPVISLWVGNDYLLPSAFVLWFSVNQYIGWNHRMVGYFRHAVGKFGQDRPYMVASAVVNVVLSISLVRFYGVAGLLAATCVAHMLQWIGRSKVVFSNVFQPADAVKYWIKQLGLALLAALEAYATILLCRGMPVSIWGTAQRILLCLVLPNTVNLLILWNLQDFSYIRQTVKQFWSKRKGLKA